MRNICGLSFLLIGICLSNFAWGQTGVTLLVATDIDCNWKLDGRPMGLLKADASKVIPVSTGEHLIEAATTDGFATTRTKVMLDLGSSTVAIQLKSQHDQQSQLKRAETPREPVCADSELSTTWTDAGTRLMWTKKDNGRDVDWNQAIAYCSKLQLAGYSGWRLPTIGELQGIYDPSISCRKVFDNSVTYTVHVKGNLNLTGWELSSTPGEVPDGPWEFIFDRPNPQRGFHLGAYFSLRALCVRPSGE